MRRQRYPHHWLRIEVVPSPWRQGSSPRQWQAAPHAEDNVMGRAADLVEKRETFPRARPSLQRRRRLIAADNVAGLRKHMAVPPAKPNPRPSHNAPHGQSVGQIQVLSTRPGADENTPAWQLALPQLLHSLRLPQTSSPEWESRCRQHPSTEADARRTQMVKPAGPVIPARSKKTGHDTGDAVPSLTGPHVRRSWDGTRAWRSLPTTLPRHCRPNRTVA